MIPSFRLSLNKSFLAAAALSLAASGANADTRTWQLNGATNNWTVAAENNWFIDAGSTLSPWVNGNAAVFNAATGETVTLVGTVTPTSVTVGANNGNWIFNGSGLIGGTGSFTKTGTGTVTLANTSLNTYTGGTNVSAGTLQIGDGTGASMLSGAVTIASGATLRFNNNNANTATNKPAWGTITGAGTLALNTTGVGVGARGWGDAVLSTGFTGKIVIENGRLSATNPASFGNASDIIVKDGGQLGVWNGGTFSQNLTISGTGWGEVAYGMALRLGNNGSTATMTGTVMIDGSATIGAQGGGTGIFTNVISGGALTIGGGSGTGTVIFSGNTANTYTGVTTINSGKLELSKNAGVVAIAGDITLNNANTPSIWFTADHQLSGNGVLTFINQAGGHGRFMLEGTTQSIAGINNVISGVVQNSESGVAGPNNAGTGTLILTGAGNYAFSGHLRNGSNGTLALVKNGTGTQTLSGDNISYTGATTVTGGTLRLVGTSGFNSAITNNAVVEFNSTLAAGPRVNAALSGSGTFNKTGTGVFRIVGATPITATGQFNIQAGTLQNDNNAVNWSGNKASIDVSEGAILDLYADAIYLNVLTGKGFVQNNYGNASAQSGSVARQEQLVLGTNNGSGTFEGVIRNNATNASLADGAGRGGIELVKVGTGTQTLSGANTYTGKTIIKNGTLALVGGDNRLAAATAITIGDTDSATTGKLVLGNATGKSDQTVSGLFTAGSGGSVVGGSSAISTLTVNATGNATFGGTLGGAGANENNLALTKSGAAVLTLSGVNTFTGPVQITGGTLSLQGNNALANTVAVTLADVSGATLFLVNSEIIGTLSGGGATGGNVNLQTVRLTVSGGDTVYAGIISGTGTTGGLTKSGTGMLTLTGANTYTGTTVINAGAALMIGNGGTSGSINSTSAVTANGALIFNRSDDLTMSKDIGGTGTFEQRGAGVLTLTGTNTYSGLTTVSSGTLQLGSAAAHNGNGAIAIAAGGLFDANDFDLTATSSLDGSVGALTGGGEMRLNGTPTFTVNQTAGTSVFSGTIAGTNVDASLVKTGAGTLALSGTSNFAGEVTVNDGVLQIGNGGATGNLTEAAGITLAGGTLAFSRSDTFTFDRNITGAGGLTQKSPSSGVVILTGTNDYTGLTHVVSGTIRLGSASAFGGGAITIDAGATFDIGTTAMTLSTTALSGAGTLSAATGGNLTIDAGTDSTFAGSIAGFGNFIKTGAANFTLTGTSNDFAGTLTVNEGDLVLGGATGTISNTGGLITVTATGGLVFDHTAATEFGAAVNGGGTVTQRGAGATDITGLVSGGVAVTNEGGAAGALTLTNAGDLGLVTNAGATTILGDASTVSVVNNTAGTLTLSSEVTGAIDVTGGVVVIGADHTDTYARITGTATNVAAGGTLRFGGAGSYTVSGFSGDGLIERRGAAGSVITLAADNSGFTGTLKLDSGTVAITDALNVGSAILELNGGKLQVGLDGGSLVSLGNAVNAKDGVLSYLTGLSNVDLAGALSGTGAIRFKGPGVLTAANEADFESAGGQIIRDGDTLDIKGDDAFGATNFNDNIGVTNNGGAGATDGNFVVLQNQDGVASGVFSDGSKVLGLVKNGVGTLTLTGANTYTGTTTVNDGVLRVGDGTVAGDTGKLGAGLTTINANSTTAGTLAFARTDDVAVSVGTVATGAQVGALALVHTGTLAQDGAGKLTLTAASATTLELGNLTGAGAIELNNIALTVKTDPATGAVKTGDTYAGALSGATGSLEKTGAGTFVLSGDSALTTVTKISGGTLQLGNGGTSGSLGAGDIALSGGFTSGATLAVDRSDTLLIASKITGQGALHQMGGTLVLTGTNTYAGKTTIDADATLQIGNGGATGKIGGGLVDNSGLLAFNRSGDLNFSNSITGSGSVEQRGAGVLTFTGTNSYTGETRVVNGTLIVNTASLPGGRFVSDTSEITGAPTTGTLIFNGTGAATIQSGVVGDGLVKFRGAGGVTTLSGDSSGFSGDMSVENAHTLKLGTPGNPETLGSGSALLTVQLGGKLSGSATIGGSLKSFGTISPGFSPGIITVTGDFTSLGTLNMEIAGAGVAGASDGFDQVNFGGQATLGGTLNVNFTGGFAPAAGFRVVLLNDTDTTDGLPSFNGDFTTVNVTGGSGRVFTSDGVMVFFNGDSITQISGLELHDGVAPFADALTAGSAVHPQLANFLTLDNATLARELQNASPIGLAALTALPTMQASRDSDDLRRRAEMQTMAADTPFGDATDWLAYLGGSGSTLDADSGSGSPAFDTRTYGALAGLERRIADGSTAIGVRLGYDRGTATLHGGGGKVDQDHARCALYVINRLGDNGYVTGGVGMGYSSYETKRSVLSGLSGGSPVRSEQKASPTGWDLSASVEGGYIFRLSREWSLTPHAGLTVVQAQVAGFTERGSDLALAVDGYSQTSGRTRLGTGLYREWLSKNFTRNALRLGVDISYEHTLFGEKADIPASFANFPQGGSFTTPAQGLIKDSLVLGPQVQWVFDESRSISAGYRFEMGFDGSTGHRADIAFEQRF